MNILERARGLFIRALGIESLVGNAQTNIGFVNRYLATDTINLSKAYQGIFFKCLDLRANNLSEALQTMTVHRKIAQEEYEEVEFNHPWVDLLNNPAGDILSIADLYYITSLNIDLVGEQYFYVAPNERKIPSILIPIYPAYGYFEAFIDNYGKISRYRYHKNGGGVHDFDASEIVRLYRPHPNAPYEAMSLVKATAYQLDIDRFMRIYMRDNAQRGGITATVFSTDQVLKNPDQRKELRDTIAERYMGLAGVGRAMLLWGGLEPKQVQMNPKDIQFLESVKDIKDDIFIITGVPRALFENVTTVATANSARIVFMRNEIQPTVNRLASQLTSALTTAFNADGMLRIFPDDIIPTDFDEEMRIEQQDVEHGVLTINDILRKRGYNEIGTEGDQRFIRAGLLPLDFYSQDQRSAVASDIDTDRAVTQSRSEDADTAWLRRINQAKNRLYSKNSDILRQYFLNLGREVVKKLKNRSGARALALTVDDVYDIASDLEQIQNITREMAFDAMQRGWEYAQRRLKQYDIDFDFNAKEMREIISDLTELTKTVPHHTKEKLQKIVEDGIREGLSEAQLGSKITDAFKDMATYRANAIARTNTNSSFEGSQNSLYSKAGIQRKRWLSRRIGQDRRESHLEADGQEVGIEESFIVDGESLRYPGDVNGSPGNTINCECTEIPVVD